MGGRGHNLYLPNENSTPSLGSRLLYPHYHPYSDLSRNPHSLQSLGWGGEEALTKSIPFKSRPGVVREGGMYRPMRFPPQPTKGNNK